MYVGSSFFLHLLCEMTEIHIFPLMHVSMRILRRSTLQIPGLPLDPRLIWLIAFTQISGDMATEHINGNGPEDPMDTSAAVTHSEHFQTLLEAGLPQKVAEKLDEIYIAGKAQ